MVQVFFSSLIAMIWRLLAAAGRMVWSMLRPGLRFIAAVFFVAATVALTIDVTRWQTSAAGPTFKSLEAHIRSAAPATLDEIAKAVSDATHPLLWDLVVTSLLALPAWLTLLLAAMGLTYATRERRQVDIFIN